ncbi:MAG: ATPase, P-type (transporting), superfamily, subfamily, partial [Acidobacteria bacterium]|nr:ATPase, P-type (transporting), superfamily, subfamily [Acidobacteriota bacterium]
VLFFPFDPQTRLLLLPIEPVQILWINLVAAVALALPLAFEAKEADVMRRPPRDPKAPVLSGFVIWRTVVAALLMTAGAIGVFLWELGQYVEAGTAHGVALAEAQTMAVRLGAPDRTGQQPGRVPRHRHRAARAGRIRLRAGVPGGVRQLALGVG